MTFAKFLPNFASYRYPSGFQKRDEIQIYDTFEADLDFSEFWYTHKSKLPKLTTLVMSICCDPPTTVASENDFSMGADIIWPKRNKLSDKRLHCISFIKRNLR